MFLNKSTTNQGSKKGQVSTYFIERKRAVTDESIDKILGLSDWDAVRRKRLNGDFLENQSSHKHPTGSVPINDLSSDELFMIIANYDLDRNRTGSEHYLKEDRDESEISYLLDELSYAAYLRLNNFAKSDLAVMGTAIRKSKYLASHPGMKELDRLTTHRWLELYKQTNPQTTDDHSLIGPQQQGTSTTFSF